MVQTREMPAQQTARISLRRILAGERIFKKLNVPEWKIVLHEWLEKSPRRFDSAFEFFFFYFSSGEYLHHQKCIYDLDIGYELHCF